MICRMEGVSKQLEALNEEAAKKEERLEKLRNTKRKESDQQMIQELQVKIGDLVTEKEKLNG